MCATQACDLRRVPLPTARLPTACGRTTKWWGSTSMARSGGAGACAQTARL